MFFVVDIDTRQLEVAWRDSLDELSNACRVAVQNASTEGAAEARTVHVYKDRSGTLTGSVSGRLTGSSRGYADGEIVSTAEYASYVEGGTKPHPIWPKEGEHFVGPVRRGQGRRASTDIGTHRVALRWQGADGATHFAKMVNHPGSKPHPFMGPAYHKAERVLLRDIETSIERVRAILEI